MPLWNDGTHDFPVPSTSSSPDPTSSSSSRLTRAARAPASSSTSKSSAEAFLTTVNFSSILKSGLNNNSGATSSLSFSDTTSNLAPDPTSTPTSDPTINDNPKTPLPVGVIVGGSIGGLAVVLLAIILLISAREQSRRMRGLGRGTRQMVNLRDQPRRPRNTDVVPFVHESADNTISSRNTTNQNSKALPFPLPNEMGLIHSQRPTEVGRQGNVETVGRRQISAPLSGSGSSTEFPPGLAQTTHNVGLEQSAGNHQLENTDNRDITPFVLEESPPSYHVVLD